MDNWISVDDILPEDFDCVLCFRPDAQFDKRRVQMYKKTTGFKGVYKVTHWQPLPPAPLKEKDDD